jgi:hypothetical protein
MQPICTHKISVQSSKPSHAYPIIRLPREFRRLAGAAATIYKTTHNGTLAFLVVPKSDIVPEGLDGHISDSAIDMYNPSLYTAKVGRSNRLEPTCFCNFFGDTTQERSWNELSTSTQLLDTDDCEARLRQGAIDQRSPIPSKRIPKITALSAISFYHFLPPGRCFLHGHATL